MSHSVLVKNVSKGFNRHGADRAWTLQERIARGLRRVSRPEYFWALRDVSFTVGQGRTVGLVGANGSGKSTMLRLIGGVGRPDAGDIQVNGRIGALLDLGAGFHPELTGRENCVMAGILNGLSRRETLERMDAIVSFAGLERAIDNPVRTYSTGMRMRLAFSVAVHADPDILIIDEVLSVGDVVFQQKCLDRISAFKASGCSILLVSHEAGVVADLCDDAVWLQYGRLMAAGAADDVVRDYMHHMRNGPTDDRPAVDRSSVAEEPASVALSASELHLSAVCICDERGEPRRELRSGEPVRIDLEYVASRQIDSPMFHVRIARQDGLVCLDLTTDHSSLETVSVQGRGRVSVWLDRLDVNSGRYLVSAGCHSHDWKQMYDQQADGWSFIVRGHETSEAVMDTPYRWELTERALQ